MYSSPYNFGTQANIERINTQINELQKMKEHLQHQPQQPTNLTQNFQLAPTNRETIKYAISMDEIKREMVVGDTPYFSKDMSVVWIKNTNGDIKTYELTEIIPKDEKDLKIEYLEAQISELKKGMLKNELNANIDEPVADANKSKKPASIPTTTKSNKKSR